MFFRRFQRKLTFRNSGTTLKREQKPSKSTVLIFFLYRNQYRARRSQPQDAFVCKGCLCCAQPFQHNIGRGIKIANSDSMEVFALNSVWRNVLNVIGDTQVIFQFSNVEKRHRYLKRAIYIHNRNLRVGLSNLKRTMIIKIPFHAISLRYKGTINKVLNLWPVGPVQDVTA